MDQVTGAKASPAKPSVPNAETLIALMSAWGAMPGHKFNAAYPFFDADRAQAIRDYGLKGPSAKLEATALLFSDYAAELYWSASAKPEVPSKTRARWLKARRPNL